MVRKQCFEVGCLGRKFIQTCGAVFQVGCDSELSFLWFLGRKKKSRKKNSKQFCKCPHHMKYPNVLVFVVAAVVGRTQPQESRLPSPTPSRYLGVQTRAIIDQGYFMCKSQVTHRDPLCLLLLWGLQGSFAPQDTCLCLATLGSLFLVPQAGGAGVGWQGTELLHTP